MSRLISVGVLAVLIVVACTAGFFVIENCADSVGDALEASLDAANSGDLESTRALAARAESEFERREGALSVFIHADLVEQLGSQLAMLSDLVAEETLPEFCAEANKALIMLTHISHDTKPSITNVF